MSRQGSADSRGLVFYHTVRHGLTWALLVMLALMMVLVDLGMD